MVNPVDRQCLVPFLVLLNKDKFMFLSYIFSYFHLFLSSNGYLKIADNDTSAEYNPDKNSDFEGYNNKDIGDNVSITPDSCCKHNVIVGSL